MITTVCKISYGSQTVPPIVPAVQGDTGRAISFEIADFTPPAGATATYFILKPSGEAIYNSATITDNSILCELTAQSLAEAGENRMQVRVLHGEDIVTSFEVILMVRTFLGDDAIESGTEMNIFDQAVEQATEQFQENAEQIVEEVIESIPADYTALTEEVDELNERLSDVAEGKEAVFTDLSQWVNGYFNTDGTITSSSQIIAPMDEPYLLSANHTISVNPNGLSCDIITFSFNGTTYIRTSAQTFTTAQSFTYTTDTYIGLQFKKIPQSTITPNEFTGTIQLNTEILDRVIKNENDISANTAILNETVNSVNSFDAELFDTNINIDNIATLENSTTINLLSENLEANKYWGSGGLVSVTDPYKDYYALSTLVPVNPGQIIVLENFGLIGNTASAIIGMYDNDGNNAPGRVNYNSSLVIDSIVKDSFINRIAVKVSDTATQIGLFFAVEKNSVVPSGLSYTPTCSLYDGNFAFSAKAENKINEIVNDIIDDITIETTNIISDYYIKGEAPKLERTKKLCIIGAGQSNIEGRVPIADAPNYISLPMVGMYFERNTTSGEFVNNYPETSLWSFDLITCYNLIQNLGSNNLYYIKWTQGGTSIDLSGDGTAHWTPDYETLTPQNALILQFNKEIQASIVNNPDDFEIGAMIWHQGEGDRTSYSQTAATNYYYNLKKVIAFCRGIAQNECLPFICGTISENSAQYDATIDAAIRRIGNEDPYVYVIDMSNAQLLDNYHFNAAWSEYLGQKVYDALIDAKVITGNKINPSEPT